MTRTTRESITPRYRVFAESHGAPLVTPPWLLCFKPPPAYYLALPGARQTQSTPRKPFKARFMVRIATFWNLWAGGTRRRVSRQGPPRARDAVCLAAATGLGRLQSCLVSSSLDYMEINIKIQRNTTRKLKNSVFGGLCPGQTGAGLDVHRVGPCVCLYVPSESPRPRVVGIVRGRHSQPKIDTRAGPRGIESDKGEVGEKALYIDIDRTNFGGQSSGKRTVGHIEPAECGSGGRESGLVSPPTVTRCGGAAALGGAGGVNMQKAGDDS
ncbi:hypothetical protein E2C01_033297 [Portunus trituberculatus]|uniref:Uncharacterized protein n=1 Tax=Portunus trituberculatus TaxID=210409 RepID=A0A5B7F3N6_PORTR|nr:hypothetical protein [Portunus trituberculatus]